MSEACKHPPQLKQMWVNRLEVAVVHLSTSLNFSWGHLPPSLQPCLNISVFLFPPPSPKDIEMHIMFSRAQFALTASH